MGWRFDKKGDKFRIWSTVVDDYLTDWLDRKEVIAYIYQDRLESFKKGIVELYMTFPDKRGTMEGMTIHTDKERREAHSSWIQQLCDRPDEDYERELNHMNNAALEYMEIRKPDQGYLLMDVGIVKKILNNDMGEWGTPEFRAEFISILKIILYHGDYSSIQHGTIYSYWKGESSDRLMNTDDKGGAPILSREYAWDILRRINLGSLVLPDDMIKHLKYTHK